MTEFEMASLAVTVAIGLGQIGIVWYGIRAMNRASDVRAQDHDQYVQTQDQRHAEAMRALEALIERTAPAAD